MTAQSKKNLERLLNGLVDGVLAEEEKSQLADMLRADASARRRYRQFVALHADLHWDYVTAAVSPTRQLANTTDGSRTGLFASRDSDSSARRMPILRWVSLGAAVAALILVITGRVLFFPATDHEPDSDRLAIGRVTRLAGEVQLVYRGEERDVIEEDGIRAGVTIHIRGLSGLALLNLDNGTEIGLTGESRIECTRKEGQTSITVHVGQLSASVSPQPAGHPLLIHTPNSQIEVLGTRLAVSVDDNVSELGVRQGHVRFKRLSDGRSIEVTAGQCAVVSQQSTLEARPWHATTDTWHEDFEDGLPTDWRYGQWVTESLPEGSQGGVRASRRFALDGTESDLHRVTLPKRWNRGLWRIQDDTYLHFTYKMSQPGWFHVMMGVRSDDLNPSHVGNYELQSGYWQMAGSEEWQTFRVPLSAFRKNARGVEYSDLPPTPPRSGDIATLLWFSTGAEDRGLVIDRIWIDHNGQPIEDLQ